MVAPPETVPGVDWRVYLVSLQIFSMSRLRRAGSMNLPFCRPQEVFCAHFFVQRCTVSDLVPVTLRIPPD